MNVEPYNEGVSVKLTLTEDEARKLNKEYDDSISWARTPTISDLVSEILEYADVDL